VPMHTYRVCFMDKFKKENGVERVPILTICPIHKTKKKKNSDVDAAASRAAVLSDLSLS
jgi:hypothetical protein